MKDYVWEIGGHFISTTNAAWPFIAIAYTFLLFVLCVIFDYAREKIFGMIRIDGLLKVLDSKIDKMMGNEPLT